MVPAVRMRRGLPDRLGKIHVPAPIGGINTVAAGVDMPRTDSVYCYNMIGAEYGLRTRLGWREWCTNLATGGVGEEVRSLLPFTGSVKSGANNRLFAVTASGIWDVSSSSQAPSRVVAAAQGWLNNADAGWGISTVFVTAAGHFLLYCDEANGYWVYNENGATWTQVAQAATTAWAPNTVYALNARVTNSGVSYIATTGGTSDVSPATGPNGTGTGIADGSVVWAYSPSIAGVNPANLAFVVAWKNRVWFVEKDTGRGWYLPVNSIYGTAASFNFGARFKAGGDLRGMWSWTWDGGSGIDDRLVVVSGGGDVLIYAGTDPSQAGTFGLTGVWFVGAVPAGRRLCTDFGGDLLIMSSLGILPVSKLSIGSLVLDRSQYQTFKIANLFNQLQSATATVRGWSMRLHPVDSALMVLVPVASGQASQQLVMSLTTRGWYQYRDLPIGACAEPWGGTMYFGTEDGRVCANDGYLDGVLLSNPGAYTPIEWSLLSAYSNLGDPRKKRIPWIKATLVSQGGGDVFQGRALFDWDMAEPAPVTGSAVAGSGTWDTAIWDSASWSGAYTSESGVFGSSGFGSTVALAIRGKSTSRTVLTGFDVAVEVGGLR